MSQLIKKYQKSCIDLTNIMERNVRTQADISDWIIPRNSDLYFNTDCDEFHNFVTMVNNDAKYKTFIKVNNKSCNHIKTSVDLKKELITYTLS